MPVAGYIRVRAGGFPIETLDWLGVPSLVPRSEALAETAKTVHFFGGIAIAGLIALHVAAAAYHGIVPPRRRFFAHVAALRGARRSDAPCSCRILG